MLRRAFQLGRCSLAVAARLQPAARTPAASCSAALSTRSAERAAVMTTAANPASPVAAAPPSCIRVDSAGAHLLLSVHVRAGHATVDSFALSDGVLEVRLRQAPRDGAANVALVAFLAAELGLRKSAVHVVSGQTQRTKTVRVDSTGDSGSGVKNLSVEALLQRVRDAQARMEAAS